MRKTTRALCGKIICNNFSSQFLWPGVFKFSAIAALTTLVVFFIPETVFAGKRYVVASGSWNSTAVWSASSGGLSGASVPAGSDTVYISEAAVSYSLTIPSGYAAQCAGLFMGSASANAASTITFAASTTSLTASGDVVIYQQGATSVTRSIDVNAGTFIINGNLSLANGVSGAQVSKIARVVITSGTLTVTGNIIFNGLAAAQAVINMSTGAGTANLGGKMEVPASKFGTLSPGTLSTFVYNGAADQTVATGSSLSYSHLKVDKPSGTAALGGALTLNGDFILERGLFSTGGFNFTTAGNWTNNGGQLSGGPAITFAGSSKTIGGTNPTSFGVMTFNPGTSYTISNSNTSAGLVFTAGATAISLTHSSGGNLTVNGNVAVSQPTASVTNSWNINAGSASVTGTVDIGGNNTTVTRIARVAVTSGTLTANNIIFSSASTTPQTAVLDMSGGAGRLNLAGSIALTNASGTLAAGTASTVNFNGTSAQTISFAGNLRYNNVHANNPAGLTLPSAVTPALVTGDIRIQDGVFDNGGYAISGASGKTFEVADGATFRITGTAGMATGFGTKIFGLTSTVDYAALMYQNQTVSAENYGNLTISASGGNRFAAGPINIFGNFNLVFGTFWTQGYNLSLYGNFMQTNNGTYANGGDTTILAGSGTQNLNSPFTVFFKNLVVRKSGGVVTLSNDLSVGGTLKFESGNIKTGTYKVMASVTGISGAGQATGWVDGNLQKKFSKGTDVSNTYEIGDSNFYTPLSVNIASVTATGSVIARTTGTDHPLAGGSAMDPARSVNRHWKFTNYFGELLFTVATINFSWVNTDVDAGADPSGFGVNSYNSSWSPVDGANAGPTYIQATGITSFTEYAVGKARSQFQTLPVTLNSFTVTYNKETAFLDWQASDEINHDYFEVERSKDGATFRKVAVVKGAGHGQDIHNYSYKDPLPALTAALVYYRLKQVDSNGLFSYSAIRVISPGRQGYRLRLYPNPASGSIQVTVPSAAITKMWLGLYDRNGSLVKQEFLIQPGGPVQVNVAGLPPGIYTMKVKDQNANEWTEQFIKE